MTTTPLRFTPLERTALQQICGKHPEAREALAAQLATAKVIRRTNSGAGFFTYLDVDRSTAPIKSSETVLGNIAARIEGFEQPLLVLLFIKNGYADMLEGATIDDSTVGIDLATVRFTIDSD